MLLGKMGLRKTVVAGGIALLALAAWSLPGEAAVKPGDFITPDNASQVKDLVSPGVFYKVQHGMTMKIVPTERIDWPPPYKDATNISRSRPCMEAANRRARWGLFSSSSRAALCTTRPAKQDPSPATRCPE